MRNFKMLVRNFLVLPLLFLTASSWANTPIEKNNDVLSHIPVKISGKIHMMTLKQAADYFKVPAVSFVIIQNNHIVDKVAFGFLSTTHKEKINTNTLFQAGSISKTVAAIAALKLVQQKLLNLDTSVNPMLKGWKIHVPKKYMNNIVTLRELLSMSAGLNVGGYYGYAPNEKLPTLIETLQGIKPANNLPVKMIYHPGNRYHYSGGGYEVIQLLINSKTKKQFPQLVDDTILKPLNMNHSNYQQPLSHKLSANAAQATDFKGNSFSYKWRITPEYAAGGLWSTPTDLAKLIISIIQSYRGNLNSILSQKLAREALTRQKNSPYSLGFVVAGKETKLHFMKLGQNSGYQGWLVGYPMTGQGAVVMTNSDNGRKLAQDIVYAIAKVYLWPTNGKLKDAWMIY